MFRKTREFYGTKNNNTNSNKVEHIDDGDHDDNNDVMIHCCSSRGSAVAPLKV